MSVGDWIVSDPEVLGGKPRVRGTRLSVAFILELLGSGATQAEILAAYPQLTAASLAAALEYAAKSLGNEVIWEAKIPA